MKNCHAETVELWMFDRVGGRVTVIFLTAVRSDTHTQFRGESYGNYRFLVFDYFTLIFCTNNLQIIQFLIHSG